MSDELRDWPRPHYLPGGGEALLYFVIFGAFSSELPAFSKTSYRSTGPTEEMDLRLMRRPEHADWIDGWIDWYPGQELEETNPELFASVRSAPDCFALRLEEPDPDQLNYLRNTVGLASYLLDNGGVSVLDVQTLRYFTPAEWHKEVFEPNAPVVDRHVAILQSDEDEPGLVWLHTRGLRKFGRPDLSVPRVSERNRDAVIGLCDRLIGLQALGDHIPEGQEIEMEGLPAGLVCHHQGKFEDPEFNNVHIEIRGDLS